MRVFSLLVLLMVSETALAHGGHSTVDSFHGLLHGEHLFLLLVIFAVVMFAKWLSK